MIKVDINRRQCDYIVELLNKVSLPEDKEDVPAIQLPPDVLKNYYFVVVAICHQTTPLNGIALQGHVNGLHLKGWDYLTAKLFVVVNGDHSLVGPNALSIITLEQLSTLLRDDDGKLSICDLSGRAALLRDIGAKMLDSQVRSVQNIYDRSNGFLFRSDNTGLLAQLSQYKAYSDPVMKKSLFFASLMKNHKLWSYVDDEHLGPPVDYHEIRGHLRYGSVNIVDKELLNKIQQQHLVTEAEDVAIRKGVYDAIMYISRSTGKTPSILHYYFWNLFRNCCNRSNPHCDRCPHQCSLPARYSAIKDHLTLRGCMLSQSCKSRKQNPKIIEHNTITDYY